ncbi:MAG: hypothetical protein MUO24_02950 [Desulfobacterales bacterium]|nr:hypothetical protein [Desulfobacterales bacterium]
MSWIMKKPNINLTLVLIIFAFVVVGITAYISILGENDKIDRIIAAYFDDLKNGMYLEAGESFSSNFQEGQLSSNEQRLNFNFLLELSLLKHYDLIDHHDYKVELKRSHFWIPYMSNGLVRVSVLLKRRDTKQVLDVLSNDQSRNLIYNLIVVVRDKNTWKIKEFAIADSSLSGIYNDLQQNLDLNKYIKMTSDGFRFNNAEINFKALTPIDKRLLIFSLYKIEKLLIVPRKKTEGFPMPH